MGSWNGTCFMTGLPVLGGDIVRMLLLTSAEPRERGGEGHCYPDQYWVPTSFAVKCTYEDYGRYIPVDGQERMVNMIVDNLKTRIVEFDLGKNKSHDIAVKRDALNWKLINKALHENRLFVNGMVMEGPRAQLRKANVPMAWIAIHENIWQAIVGQETKDWRGRIHNLEAVKNRIIDSFNGAREKTLEQVASNDMYRNMFSMLMEQFLRDELRRDFQGSYCVDGIDQFVETMVTAQTDDPDLFNLLVTAWAELRMVNNAVGDMRKTWMPCSGAGSQAQEFELFELVAKAQADYIAAKRR